MRGQIRLVLTYLLINRDAAHPSEDPHAAHGDQADQAYLGCGGWFSSKSVPISHLDETTELICHLINHGFILSFNHDPYYRFGAGRSYQDSAGSTEFFFEL
jgi:hypothetical protein